MRGGLAHHMLGGNPSGGPGVLKVKAAGDAVDVQYFPGEMESGAHFALHGLEIHFGKCNSAAFHKFVLIPVLS